MSTELPGSEHEQAALKVDPAGVAFIQTTAQELAAGPKPELLFLCATAGGGVVTLQASPKDKPVALVFTTALAAMDYISEKKMAAQVHSVKFEEMPEMSRKWLAAGAGGLALNRCPRCSVILSTPIAEVANREKFVMFWALRRAAQIWFGQKAVRQYLAAKETAARRAAMELIRDHVDCAVPYVYEFLAFFARMEGDEPGKKKALEQLVTFGPQFANWEARWDPSSREIWVRAMAEAHVGLCLSFGIQLKGPTT
jgi:hypothetical protein